MSPDALRRETTFQRQPIVWAIVVSLAIHAALLLSTNSVLTNTSLTVALPAALPEDYLDVEVPPWRGGCGWGETCPLCGRKHPPGLGECPKRDMILPRIKSAPFIPPIEIVKPPAPKVIY